MMQNYDQNQEAKLDDLKAMLESQSMDRGRFCFEEEDGKMSCVPRSVGGENDPRVESLPTVSLFEELEGETELSNQDGDLESTWGVY